LDFSVIIPTYRRETSLQELLHHLTALDYDRDLFEVVVINDGGEAFPHGFSEESLDLLRVKFLRQQNRGPAAARNAGAAVAEGRRLVFIDDDCRPFPQWLSAYAERAAVSPEGLCGGRTINALDSNAFSSASQLLMDYLNLSYRPADHLGGFYPANNFCVARKSFVEIGGFNQNFRFGEDRELCYRWALSGRPFDYATEALVSHAHSLTLKTFVKLHFSYGQGSCRVRRFARKEVGRPIRIGSPLFYAKLVLAGTRGRAGRRGVSISALLALTQGVNAVGMLWEALGGSEAANGAESF